MQGVRFLRVSNRRGLRIAVVHPSAFLGSRRAVRISERSRRVSNEISMSRSFGRVAAHVCPWKRGLGPIDCRHCSPCVTYGCPGKDAGR